MASLEESYASQILQSVTTIQFSMVAQGIPIKLYL